MKKIKKYIRNEKASWLIIGILLVLGVKIFFFNNGTDTRTVDSRQEQLEDSTEKEVVQTGSDEIEGKMYVDIKGAVKKPGMYEVTSDMRVLNVIDLAGGLSEEADDKKINFSQKLEDQMIVYVPVEGEEIPDITNNNGSGNNLSNDTKQDKVKVNLNQAEKDELMTLNGIGDKKAEKIIEYREENGSFKSIEELKNVSGFGDKTVENLKESIGI